MMKKPDLASLVVTTALATALGPAISQAEQAERINQATSHIAVNGASYQGNAQGKKLPRRGHISLFRGAADTYADDNYFAEQGKPLPTELGGIRINIGGVDAHLSYAGPNQVNAQISPDTPIGDKIPVEIYQGGKQIAKFDQSVDDYGPGIFFRDPNRKIAWAFRNIQTGPWEAIGPDTGVDAKAGDLIFVYATGLGPSNVEIPGGQGASSANNLTSPLRAYLGSGDDKEELRLVGAAATEFAGVDAFVFQVGSSVSTSTKSLEVCINDDCSNGPDVSFRGNEPGEVFRGVVDARVYRPGTEIPTFEGIYRGRGNLRFKATNNGNYSLAVLDPDDSAELTIPPAGNFPGVVRYGKIKDMMSITVPEEVKDGRAMLRWEPNMRLPEGQERRPEAHVWVPSETGMSSIEYALFSAIMTNCPGDPSDYTCTNGIDTRWDWNPGDVVYVKLDRGVLPDRRVSLDGKEMNLHDAVLEYFRNVKDINGNNFYTILSEGEEIPSGSLALGFEIWDQPFGSVRYMENNPETFATRRANILLPDVNLFQDEQDILQKYPLISAHEEGHIGLKGHSPDEDHIMFLVATSPNARRFKGRPTEFMAAVKAALYSSKGYGPENDLFNEYNVPESLKPKVAALKAQAAANNTQINAGLDINYLKNKDACMLPVGNVSYKPRGR